jgi:acyl-CoA thioesterase-1
VFTSRPVRGLVFAALLGVMAGACSGGNGGAREAAPPAPASPPAPQRPARTEPAHPRIVVLGDSLTAGLGLPETDAYPAILQQKLKDAGYDWEVVNAGVSGDTSAAGLQRLEWVLDGDVRILILALGANDGLRGLPPAQMRENLATIIETAQKRGIAVLLAGMEAPPNFGQDYAVSFRRVFRDLAKKYDVVFVPFLLDHVAGIPALNQADGIHPNARGARLVADGLWPALKPMVEAAATAS